MGLFILSEGIYLNINGFHHKFIYLMSSFLLSFVFFSVHDLWINAFVIIIKIFLYLKDFRDKSNKKKRNNLKHENISTTGLIQITMNLKIK